MTAAELIALMLQGYVLLGLMFACVFVTRGIGRMDDAARGATLAVRLILIPGSVALWPLLLRKWSRVTRGGE